MLLKAKQWLTLDDASKRLSESFDEDVTPKDILQLAIENKLNISYLLSGRVDLLMRDEDALYGWLYTEAVINDKALRIKIDGLIKMVLSEIVLGVTDIDSDLYNSDGYWWSVIDGDNEFRPIWIGRDDIHDEYFVDKVENIPLKLRWLVIQTVDLLEFERLMLKAQDQKLKLSVPLTLDRRKAELERLIENVGLDNLKPLGRLGVWQKLTEMNPVLFPVRIKADETVKAFYNNNPHISFPKGRKPKV